MAAAVSGVRRRPWNAVLAAALFIVITVLAWLRIPARDRGVMWAEDGRNFFSDQNIHGLRQVLFAPYEGYLQFAPRLIAAFADHAAPISGAAEIMTGASCVVAGLVGALIFLLAADVVPWRPARALIAALPVLIACAPVEVLGTAANVHSVVMCGVPWLLLYSPRTRWSAIVLAAIACAAALTEPQVALLLPLLLWRWRERLRWIVRGGLVVGLLAQLPAFLTTPRDEYKHVAFSFRSNALGFLDSAVLGATFSNAHTSGEVMVSALWLPVAALAAAFGAAAAVIALGTADQRVAAIVLVAAALAVWLVSYNFNPASSLLRYDQFSAATWRAGGLTLRYGYVPGVMLLSTFPLLAAVLRQRRQLAAPIALTLICLVVVATQFVPARTQRTDGALWSERSAAALRSCESSGAGVVPVQQAPSWWTAKISCDSR
ncbi:hypothetical protein [Gryllotalpicola protaetiae]|uniref:DUF2029 domain-containing protein n=1 Tax=Gryllotalpicola protaetiae TaxID=2419771 RepID=A0A387BP59_9MICO|nr:hypothetical protein [Gryllotalpicola protaetiae]AYG04262.1 hypothetical protein D7I44_12485 [Gryllotalpicola protaetiae]